MGGVTGDNIEGLSNFSVGSLAVAAGTTTLVTAKPGFTPVVETIVMSLDAAAAVATAEIQSSSGDDGVRIKADATATTTMAVSRMKLKAAAGESIDIVVAGAGATCDVYVDGRWIANEANFS